MKIIKSYSDATALDLFDNTSKKILFSIYSRENFKYWLLLRKKKKVSLTQKQKLILGLLKNRSCAWFDGFGFGLKDHNDKIVSVEQMEFKPLFNSIKHKKSIYFAKNIYSKKSLMIIDKKINPDTIVIDNNKTDYLTPSELVDFIKNLQDIFQRRKFVLCLDLRKLDFNKIKFSYDEILTDLMKDLNIRKTHVLSMFSRVLELN